MGKQTYMFEDMKPELKSEYTSKIKPPIYKPTGKKPHPLELCDNHKYNQLVKEIKASNVSEHEKEFLIRSASRHLRFNYKLIADYYAGASKEMQGLMEKSALVIIDFDKAIRLGYVKLAHELAELYKDEYEK